MNPEMFVADDERAPLEQAFRRLAMKVLKGNVRQAMLSNATVDQDFIASLEEVNASPASFATELLAECLHYTVSYTSPDYHPLLRLLSYLTAPGQFYMLQDRERALFQTILSRGQRNFKALAVRNTVGRLESPLEHAIGTGVLVDHTMLLTCAHVFDETAGQALWIRFGYFAAHTPGEVYELDPCFVSQHPRPDHALVRLKGKASQSPMRPKKKLLERGQTIYLLHHPEGNPLVVSDAGQIAEAGTAFIDHSIPTEHGSSGAPIFDKDWQLVALHRGLLPASRRTISQGSAEGIPLSALWEILAGSVSGVM